ncbi:hypothetical protein FB451DRAFT_1051080, partial [Mycena latifolia]
PRRTTTTAVIACRQCRARKIRCDSTRPHCANCSRRADTCEYDPAPKRRGPDKKPGTRQRRPKKRADTDERAGEDALESSTSASGRPRLSSPRPSSLRPRSPRPPRSPARATRRRRPTPTMSRRLRRRRGTMHRRRSTPSSRGCHRRRSRPRSRAGGTRSCARTRKCSVARIWLTIDAHSPSSLREIATELSFLFSETAIALSFVNVGVLLETLWSPTAYLTLQPAFILAAMALATLIRSSEAERGEAGRSRAAFLRHAAQDALERAWREGVWRDATLAEAALIIALYESSAHPEYHPDRLARALVFLDEILGALGLTAADASAPDVCRYARGAAPVVDVRPSVECACLPPGSPPRDLDTVGSSALPWDPAWDARAVRAEEVRRLCWGALSVATSWRTECMALGRPDGGVGMAMCEPANYLLLFPNEVYDRERGGRSGGDAGAHAKNAIWALFCRSMLLANFCGNVAGRPADTPGAQESRAEMLQEAWHETQAIQDALDAHGCNLHTAVAYLCRENVSNAQMIITKMLRRVEYVLDLFHFISSTSTSTHKWHLVQYQNEVIRRVTLSIQYLSDPRGTQLTQRPFAVTWFYHQLAICLLLWENDTSLGAVLDLAKAFLVPLEVMNALWPCPLIQLQCTALHKRLAAHCRSAGVEPPLANSGYALPVGTRGS